MVDRSVRMAAAVALALAAGAPAAWAQETATPPAPQADAGAAAAAPATAETVVATVNGRIITLGHMIVLRESLPAQYQQLPDEILFSGILEQLVQQALLEQSVEGALTRRDALAIENDRRGYLAGMALRAVVGAAVTEEALQAAWDARFKDAAPATEYNAAHILVETEERARELKAEIEGGADFAELARAHSTDPGSGPAGGELGWFGLGMMVKSFEDAVVALAPGQVSDPVQSQFGWHIVKLVETREAAPPALDEVRDELAAEIERAAVEAHLAALAEGAEVTRSAEGIDPAALRDQTLLGN